jgi:hypothetical protein
MLNGGPPSAKASGETGPIDYASFTNRSATESMQ